MVLEDENADTERALGRTSNAVKRMSMALFICEIVVYVVVLGFCFERSKKILRHDCNVGSQCHETNFSRKQRTFNINL